MKKSILIFRMVFLSSLSSTLSTRKILPFVWNRSSALTLRGLKDITPIQLWKIITKKESGGKNVPASLTFINRTPTPVLLQKCPYHLSTLSKDPPVYGLQGLCLPCFANITFSLCWLPILAIKNIDYTTCGSRIFFIYQDFLFV